MIITSIEEFNKTKLKIFIDGEFAFVLYKSELRSFKIAEGQEISQLAYQEITRQILPKRAKLRCMNLLQKKDYTRKQLIDKLEEGMYSEDVIKEAIEYIESYHYIDDVRYAKAYIGYAGHSKSRKQIEMELLRRGVSKDDIIKAYDECKEENLIDDEIELIKRFLVKKHYTASESTPEQRQKLIASLYRKGFKLDNIYKIIDEKEEFF